MTLKWSNLRPISIIFTPSKSESRLGRGLQKQKKNTKKKPKKGRRRRRRRKLDDDDDKRGENHEVVTGYRAPIKCQPKGKKQLPKMSTDGWKELTIFHHFPTGPEKTLVAQDVRSHRSPLHLPST